MKPSKIISQCLLDNIIISVKDANLRIEDRDKKLTPDKLALIKEHKQAILDELTHLAQRNSRQQVVKKNYHGLNLCETQSKYISDKYPAIEEIMRTTPLQESMVFHCIQQDSTAAYNSITYCDLLGNLNMSCFKEAWALIIARYPWLTAAFTDAKFSSILQFIEKGGGVEIEYLDWQNKQVCQADLYTYKQHMKEAGVNLEAPPLMKLVVIKLEEEKHHLIWLHHHTLIDGWSVSIIISELFSLYDAMSSGAQLTLEQPADFKEYVTWLGTQDDREAQQFWRIYLEGFSNPNVLNDFTNEAQASDYEHTEVEKLISTQKSEQIAKFASDNQCSMSTVIQLAWAKVDGEYSNQQDVVFGETVSGRNIDLPNVSRMVGMLINTIPRRVELNKYVSIKEALTDIQKQNVDREQAGFIPLFDIQKCSEIPKGQSLFDSIVIFENYPEATGVNDNASRLTVANVGNLGETNFGITVIASYSKSLNLEIKFDDKRYSHKFVESLLNHLENVLDGFISSGGAAELSSISVMTKQELNAVEYVSEGVLKQSLMGNTFVDLFAQAVSAYPKNVAIQSEFETLTYSELNLKSDQLASFLIKNGVTKEQPIPLIGYSDTAFVVGLLGILKAGGAFVPLDTSLPSSRVQSILETLQPELILTSCREYPLLDSIKEQVIAINEVFNLSVITESQVLPTVSSTELAYLIFTSGSTGVPKGVLVEHGGFCNTILSQSEFLAIEPNSTVMQFASVSFDAFCSESGLALINGAALSIPGAGVKKDASLLGTYVKENNVSHITLPPFLLGELDPAPFQGVKKILVAGDSIDESQAKRWQQGNRLVNAYGPTETSICSNMEVIQLDEHRLNIGKPIHNAQVKVVESEGLRIKPFYLEGELFIGGAGLARGYYNQPQLSNEKFIELDGKRWFKTGDIVRQLPSGKIEFIRRDGDIVKLRGYRIELKEIESALLDLVSIVQAKCKVVNVNGLSYIKAYLITKESQGVANDSKVIAEQLRKQLPNYMVPSRFLFVESFPLNNSGKIDYKKLDSMDAQTYFSESKLAPKSDKEKLLCGVISKLLDIDYGDIDLNASFIDLGGDSLAIMRLTARLNALTGQSLKVSEVFNTNSLTELVFLIEKSSEEYLIPVFKPHDRNLRHNACSFAQQRLWFLDRFASSKGQNFILGSFSLKSRLDLFHVERAIKWIVDNNYILKTNYIEGDGELIQRVSETNGFSLDVVKEDEQIALDGESLLKEKYNLLTNNPFNLETDLMIRAGYIEREKSNDIIYFCIHHIAGDGWSINILKKLFTQYYTTSIVSDAKPSEPSFQYIDYALWQSELLKDVYMKKMEGFWSEYLDGISEEQLLPRDFIRQPEGNYEGDSLTISIPKGLKSRLKNVVDEKQVSLFILLLTVWNITLYRITGTKDIVLGTDLAGRSLEQFEEIIGLFVNLLPIRNIIDGNDDFNKVLNAVRESVLGVFEHQNMPFDKIVELINPFRHKNMHPLVQSIFVLQNLPKVETGDELIEAIELKQQTKFSKFDLGVFAIESQNEIKVKFVYSPSLFKRATIQNVADNFTFIMEQLLKDASTPTYKLSLKKSALTESEKNNKLIKLKRLKHGKC
ncbi:amino acid adenylation domain-containing protein [Pseudoalteromonas rhizosphaerae]|uniref:amino acid adenylation domain-containing protein n=1 Tax=Pseudoalteromonas rhizosphaerae TaxID=2518973 RepID=UPI00384AAFAD